jgi:nucleoside phosphorylase
VDFGLILSGEKVLDHTPTVSALLAMEPEAIGGEMEGAGLYVAATQRQLRWGLIKAICDWADGQKGVDKKARQAQAARNAAAFALHVLAGGGFAPEAWQG